MTSSHYSKGIALVAVVWIVAALAVIGGGTYYASTKTEVTTDTNATTTIAADASADAQVSLRELFGKNVKCTFSYNHNGIESKGTAYIAGENMRVDAVTTQNGKLVADSHMIKVGTDAYAWVSAGTGAGYGAKIKVDATMEAQTKDKMAIDWDAKQNYNCEEWSPTQSTFSVPTDVNFIDLAAKLDAAVNASGQINKCGACDMIPDANGKAQCKAALGCK